MRKTVKKLSVSKEKPSKPGISQREDVKIGKDTTRGKRPDLRGDSSDIGYGSGPNLSENRLTENIEGRDPTR